MTDALGRLGRLQHETLGPCIRFAFQTFEGPMRIGDSGKYQRTEALFPIDQSKIAGHPRHPTGFDDHGNVIACVSPTCSFYRDLVKYGQFQWGSSKP